MFQDFAAVQAEGNLAGVAPANAKFLKLLALSKEFVTAELQAALETLLK